MPPKRFPLSRSSSSVSVIWYWKNDNNEWVPYSDNLCETLEKARCQNTKTVQVDEQRIVNLEFMVQSRSDDSSKQREVKRAEKIDLKQINLSLKRSVSDNSENTKQNDDKLSPLKKSKSDVSAEGVWYWKDEKSWTPFEPKINTQLEKRYLEWKTNDKTNSRVVVDQERYVDISKMAQFRFDDPTKARFVRREEQTVSKLSNSNNNNASPNKASERKFGQEKIMSKNPNFISANFLETGRKRADAVVYIELPGGSGTGFLIAPSLLMTNNHVLPDAKTASTSKAIFYFEENSARKFSVALRPDRCFITNESLDVTIVEIQMNQETDKVLPIPFFALPEKQLCATPQLKTFLNIIQHPKGRPKEIVFRSNEVVDITPIDVFYTTDTEPGSSGSAVFNDEWELIAIHKGWSHSTKYDGYANYGTKMVEIAKFLKNEKDETCQYVLTVLQSIHDTKNHSAKGEYIDLSESNKSDNAMDWERTFTTLFKEV